MKAAKSNVGASQPRLVKRAKALKMATEKNVESVIAAIEALILLELDAIDTSFENIRTGDFTEGDSGEDGNGQSFEMLTESIQNKGQKTPIIVRPFADPKNKKVTHQLVAGFRRYAALRHIEQTTGEKQKIKAIVKPLDDLSALVENAAENQREGIRGPDLMMGLHRIYTLSLARGEDLSGRQLAGIIGCHPSYAADLLTIKRKAAPVADLWHKAKYQLGIRDMRGIAKIEDPGLQLKKYEELLSNRAPSEDGEEPAALQNAWIDRAIKTAEKSAAMIGHLERRGGIKKVTVIWEEELETLGVKVKTDAGKKDRNKIAKRAEKAYAAALVWVEPEVEEEAEEAAE